MPLFGKTEHFEVEVELCLDPEECPTLSDGLQMGVTDGGQIARGTINEKKGRTDISVQDGHNPLLESSSVRITGVVGLEDVRCAYGGCRGPIEGVCGAFVTLSALAEGGAR